MQKTLPVFWKYGFSGTSLHQLEQATGVNKSGLYSEFEDKEDLFLHTLAYYYEHRGALSILTAEPKGYGNIERFLRLGDPQDNGCVGCFSANSLRETASLSRRVRDTISAYHHRLIPHIVENIEAEPHQLAAATIATIVMVFFTCYCIERNLPELTESDPVDAFMQALRVM